MPFHTRNSYYLRLSEKSVLPVYLYLDERHLNWMSDRILQHVLADLRPSIVEKLKTQVDAQLNSGSASSNKKPAVDTHRGDTYQFCYFFRTMEPHSLVIKKRNFVAIPPQNRARPAQPSSKPKEKELKRKGESKQKGSAASLQKKRKINYENDDESPYVSDVDEGSDIELSIIPESRRSSRAKKLSSEGSSKPQEGITAWQNHNMESSLDVDVEMVDTAAEEQVRSETRASTSDIPLGLVTEEEEKPKPILQLRYEGFNLFGQCLCIVVEPWPSIRSQSKAPTVPNFTEPRKKAQVDSIGTSAPQREQTPLFLPDDSEIDGRATPGPSSNKDLPRFTYDDSEDSDDDDERSDIGGMMEFSQVLNATGEFRSGAADDDDDMDGAVFFGDADETREL